MNPIRLDHPSSRRQHGLSLVELMVAIAISLILLAGVLQIFLSSKTSYRLLEATSRVQENGRFAIDFLSKDIRMAGFMGCYRGDVASIETILNDPTDFEWDYTTAIQGYEWTGAGWDQALPASITGQVRNGTDVIVTRGLAGDGVSLVSPFTDATQISVGADGGNLLSGDIVVVSNCNQVSIGQITTATNSGSGFDLIHSAGGSSPGNSTSDFTNIFGSGSEIARFQTVVYYIGTGASGSPALFRQSLATGGSMQDQELIDDVENMQVYYGEDLDSDGIANRYVGADDVGNMGDVVSVRISLLLRSMDDIASDHQTYAYDDTDTTAEDRRIRRIFNTTIKIRNRGLL